MMIARDFMTSDPACLKPDATVGDAIALLRELDVRHLPVVNTDREVVGMVSDRDLRGLALSPKTAVSEVMSSDVITIDADAGAYEVVEVMLEYKIGAVPVVNAEQQLIGIVSYIDMLRWLQPGLAAEREEF
jgi:acetoin utilization protein AcuB